jgi:hypothetical protein
MKIYVHLKICVNKVTMVAFFTQICRPNIAVVDFVSSVTVVAMITSVTTDYVVTTFTFVTNVTNVPLVKFATVFNMLPIFLVAKFKQACQKCFVPMTFPTFLFVSYDCYTQQRLLPGTSLRG